MVVLKTNEEEDVDCFFCSAFRYYDDALSLGWVLRFLEFLRESFFHYFAGFQFLIGSRGAVEIIGI